MLGTRGVRGELWGHVVLGVRAERGERGEIFKIEAINNIRQYRTLFIELQEKRAANLRRPPLLCAGTSYGFVGAGTVMCTGSEGCFGGSAK